MSVFQIMNPMPAMTPLLASMCKLKKKELKKFRCRMVQIVDNNTIEWWFKMGPSSRTDKESKKTFVETMRAKKRYLDMGPIEYDNSFMFVRFRLIESTMPQLREQQGPYVDLKLMHEVNLKDMEHDRVPESKKAQLREMLEKVILNSDESENDSDGPKVFVLPG